MRIAIGADHAGFELKEHFKQVLKDAGHEVVDCGATEFDPTDDYPTFCVKVARAVANGEVESGIVLGASGQGEQIVANKVKSIRAALCNDLYSARMARMHNNANVLAIGAQIVGGRLADAILQMWLDTQFEGGRHQRRIDMITDIEEGKT